MRMVDEIVVNGASQPLSESHAVLFPFLFYFDGRFKLGKSTLVYCEYVLLFYGVSVLRVRNAFHVQRKVTASSASKERQ